MSGRHCLLSIDCTRVAHAETRSRAARLIASFSNNFIFLKTRKTAGTSVEIVLSTWCSGTDVVTPISTADETIRRNYGAMPMNYRDTTGRTVFKNHMTAAAVKAAVPELWQQSFKFTVERHPYERVVSRVYWWIHSRSGDPYADFDSTLEEVLNTPDMVNNRAIYCIDDRIVCDEVIRYDQLWDRMAAIATRFGKTLPSELPRAKGTFRKDRRPASAILTQEQKQRVYEIARLDFDELGFER